MRWEGRVCLERGKMKTETRGTPTFQEVGGERRVREGVARDRREKKKKKKTKPVEYLVAKFLEEGG